MNKSKWGIVLFAVFLMGGITAANDFESVCADDVTGTTDVSVTFTDANLYIVSMPNLNFGMNHNLRDDDGEGGLKTESEGTGKYLQVNSPDTNVPFKVSVQNGTNYLIDPSNGTNIGTADLGTDSTLKLSSSDTGSVSTSQDGTSWTSDPNATGFISGANLLNGQTPINVFTSKDGFKGQTRVALDSATLNLSDAVKSNLEAKLGSYGKTGLTLIMPLTWTISIDNTQSMGL